MQTTYTDKFADNPEIEDEGPSKTQRKHQMDDLQKLGMQLVELSKDKLAKIDLPDNLLEAVKLAHKITANGAIRRQNQYIGRLMRSVDAKYVQDMLTELNSDSAKSTKLLHLCELWRERLIAEDKELDLFVTQYQVDDIGQLRTQIRACRKERTLGQIKTYRKLFKFIRDIIETEKE